MPSNAQLSWITLGGLFAFTLFMFYLVIKNPPWAGIAASAPQGAGPQPTSTT